MAAEDRPLPENTLGYSYNRGGLNNQKLALFGLFLKAFREGPPRLVLPNLCLFDIVSFNHVPIPIDQALQTGLLRNFAVRHGIEILDISPSGGQDCSWDYASYGHNFIPRAALLNELAPDSFTCEFWRSLVPIIQDSDALRKVADAAFVRRGIRLVAQLRVETDWAFHTQHRLRPTIGDTEENALSFTDIMKKISNTLPNNSDIYVVSDEAALSVPKDEIRRTAEQEFNINLFWKSDFLSKVDLSELSLLDLSMLDFEMAVAAESFVGLTRSTFSNGVALEKYARTRQSVERHYVYNVIGSRLALRRDNGAFSAADIAATADPWAATFDFQLAQIFQSTGDRQRALEHYTAWAASGKAEPEEIFISLYRAAQVKAELAFSAADVIDTYLRAADALPSRVEALHGASRYCRCHDMFKEGYEIAARGIKTGAPENGLFVEHWIYEWGLLDEYAVNAYHAGHYFECVDACLLILERDKLPADHRPRIIRNARFGMDQLKAAEVSSRR